jgi:hypothetical protein
MYRKKESGCPESDSNQPDCVIRTGPYSFPVGGDEEKQFAVCSTDLVGWRLKADCGRTEEIVCFFKFYLQLLRRLLRSACFVVYATDWVGWLVDIRRLRGFWTSPTSSREHTMYVNALCSFHCSLMNPGACRMETKTSAVGCSRGACTLHMRSRGTSLTHSCIPQLAGNLAGIDNYTLNVFSASWRVGITPERRARPGADDAAVSGCAYSSTIYT